MRKRIVGLVILALAALPPALHAQGSLCQIDLSDVNATLTRAQAAAARGEPERALALIEQADQALAAIEARCDLEVVEPDMALEQIFTAQDGSFSVSYPAGWIAAASAAANAVTLATDENAANALQVAAPVLSSGQRGALIVVGSPAEVAGSMGVERSLDGIIDHFVAQLASSFLVRNSRAVYVLDGRAVASVDFTGEAFDGTMIVVELVEGREYAVIAGAAAKGEIGALQPTLQAVAASITSGEAAG